MDAPLAFAVIEAWAALSDESSGTNPLSQTSADVLLQLLVH